MIKKVVRSKGIYRGFPSQNILESQLDISKTIETDFYPPHAIINQETSLESFLDYKIEYELSINKDLEYHLSFDINSIIDVNKTLSNLKICKIIETTVDCYKDVDLSD